MINFNISQRKSYVVDMYLNRFTEAILTDIHTIRFLGELLDQRANGPVKAHLISGPRISYAFIYSFN